MKHAPRIIKTPSLLLLLMVLFYSSNALANYSWQNPNATVDNWGNLQYTPQPFVYAPGASVIYIDYDNGNDNNDGRTQGTALKHHPWDAEATGTAKTISGVHTYVFKRGVVYRGKLVAKESGQHNNPIKLTSDPSWGRGEAGIYGSERITSGWQKCSPVTAPHIPDPTNTWYIDLPFTLEDNPYGSFKTWDEIYVQIVAEVTDTGLARVNIARAPNWTMSDPNFLSKEWWDVKWVANRTLELPVSFPVTDNDVWTGGTIWTYWGRKGDANMGTIQSGKVKAHQSGGRVIIPSDKLRMDYGNKYYIENLPFLLDVPNEFYYAGKGAQKGRLFIRLPGDRDPNTAILEIGVRPDIIDIQNKNNIEISGLTFACNNNPRPTSYTPEPPHWNNNDGSSQAIELSGTCSNITIKNNKFRHVVMGIAPWRAERTPPQIFDNILIADNDFAEIDDQSINIANRVPEESTMKRIKIFRNKLTNVGSRQTTRSYSAIPAINVNPATWVEIAGNFIYDTWGQGINVRGQVATSSTPGNQVRVLVHHNKIVGSLHGTNDWGGIEGWYDGPCFYWSNISANPRGYKHHQGNDSYNPWGGAIYIDHGVHHKVFNNIVWGVHNDPNNGHLRNPAGLFQALSDKNFFANNTVYKFYRGNAAVSGERGVYVGNLQQDITLLHESNETDVVRTGYAKNVYNGTAKTFGQTMGFRTFTEFQSKLAANGWCSQLGIYSNNPLLVNPDAGDFRPKGDAIGNGARIFLPWNLYKVKGEWNFEKNESNVNIVWGTDNPVRHSADNDLTLTGASNASFVNGNLEDWTQGALQCNGSTYGTAKNSASLDAGNGSLILEAYIKTSSSGPIMSKGGAQGYALTVNSNGTAAFKLKGYTLYSSSTVNDNNWHHILAEYDKKANKATIYIDGAADNGTTSGSLPTSLASSSTFYIAREGSQNFTGTIDFARVALSSFAESATSFDELYAWEFDGPATRDFAGSKIMGKRDAGALMFTQTFIDDKTAGLSALFNRRINVNYLSQRNIITVSLLSALQKKVPVSISVLNLAGRAVFSQNIVGESKSKNNWNINTSRWACGMYLVHVRTPDLTKTVSVVVHK